MTYNDFSIFARVYIEDTDAGGIVYYVNYLKYFERARTELFRLLGFPKPAILEDRYLLVVASAKVDYKKPAKLDQELRVTAVIKKLANTYVLFEQSIFDTQDILICKAEVKVACVDNEFFKPSVLPVNVRNAITESQRQQESNMRNIDEQ